MERDKAQAALVRLYYSLDASYQLASTRRLSDVVISSAESGAIIYSGDRRLPYEASLVKENGIWRITRLHIGYLASVLAAGCCFSTRRVIKV